VFLGTSQTGRLHAITHRMEDGMTTKSCITGRGGDSGVFAGLPVVSTVVSSATFAESDVIYSFSDISDQVIGVNHERASNLHAV
jgi:hypothetical protein